MARHICPVCVFMTERLDVGFCPIHGAALIAPPFCKRCDRALETLADQFCRYCGEPVPKEPSCPQ